MYYTIPPRVLEHFRITGEVLREFSVEFKQCGIKISDIDILHHEDAGEFEFEIRFAFHTDWKDYFNLVEFAPLYPSQSPCTDDELRRWLRDEIQSTIARCQAEQARRR